MISVLGTLVLGGSLAACGDGGTAPGSGGSNEAIASYVELSVRPSRVRVAAGDTVSITVIVRNHTRRHVELDPGDCTPLAYEVRSSAGERVGAWGFGFCGVIGGGPTTRLAPAESTTVRLGWAAIYDYGVTGGRAGQPLPTGDYTVYGGLISSRDSTDFAARSAPVTITVTSMR